jgi:hypothetical protein
MIKWTHFEAEIGYDSSLSRSLSTITLPIDIILINSVNQIFVSLIEILAASGIWILLTGTFPIGHELRVNEIMSHHPLHCINMKVLKIEHGVTNYNAFEENRCV